MKNHESLPRLKQNIIDIMLLDFSITLYQIFVYKSIERNDIMPVYPKDKSKNCQYWYYRCYYTDIYGKRKQKKSKMFKGKKVAKDAERKFLEESEKHDIIDKDILFEVVYDEWLELEKRKLKSTTYYGKKNRTNKYILSFFKDFKLHFIKINSVNSWYKSMEEHKMSTEHKNKIIGDLKAVFTYAKDNYDFDGKVVAKIQKYRVETPIDKPKDSEINFWTCDEWEYFIKHVKNYDDYVMYNFLYFTGLRYGEFCGLLWKDYNPIDKTIKVYKAGTNKTEEGGFKLVEPKTKNSYRTVDLDDDLNAIMIKFKERESKIYGFNENMFLFGNVKHTAYTTFERHLNNNIKLVQKEDENFKGITPHGFRHSHVSLLIYLGCDIYDVAERIGDTPEVVEKTYYHMFPKKKKETVTKLNSFKFKT